ncbi:hypothetical protein ACEWY4_016903 [Coilia grayii]|uniref:DDE Tnp4 domain-containing protein n=1 Tax=Coilia grayii TaxID=363190 RepID=A0ABD1JN42_9TELE
MLRLHDFCALVNVHLAHHLTWPVGDALQLAEIGFARAGFPRTISAVDGCHIAIRRPRANPNAYLNRKQYYSIILTAFCDSRRWFCHVTAGHPGSWHDARAFRHTAVATALAEEPSSLVPEGMHIIGDSAYPLLPQLMKPYRDNDHLTARQRGFNQRLHSARVVIEHAFGLLKGKFRRLNYLYMARVEDISRAVTACCILHNICIEPADRLDAEDAAVFDAVEHVEPHDNPQAAAYRDDCNN